MTGEEVEIKINLTREIYQHILKEYAPRIQEVREQDNHFLGTPDKKLRRKRWVCRVRLLSREGKLTVKGPLKTEAGAHIRPEYEVVIPLEQARTLIRGFTLSDLDLEPARKLMEITGDLTLTELFSFHNHRTLISWEGYTWELDKTRVKEHLFYELEIECLREEVKTLTTKIEALFKEKKWPLEYNLSNKFARALEIYENEK